jgi:hypothetical protein
MRRYERIAIFGHRRDLAIGFRRTDRLSAMTTGL